ncbi:MAG: LutC/YkgG family protein [Acidobacteriota bacterium]
MSPPEQQLVDGFVQALRFVGGRARAVDGATAAAGVIEERLGAAGGPRAVLYEQSDLARRLGLPLALRARGIDLVPVREAGGRAAEMTVGLTEARMGVAESGTLVVGGQNGGWGLAAALPWAHVALLRREDIVPDIAAAFAALGDLWAVGDRDWVWITGPSRTADIAKTLVTGVHGPNDLEVLILPGSGRP